MKHKFLSTISGASLYITLVLVLTKGVGFIREIVFAGYYGTGQQYDIYLVTSVIPITLNIIVFFVGQNFFIPALSKFSNTYDESLIRFSKQVFVGYVWITSILILPLFVFPGWVLSNFFGKQILKPDDAAKLIFQILLLTIPLSAGISILTAYLHSRLEFKSPAISQLYINFSIIIIVILFSKSFGNVSIASGYFCGTLLQFIYLVNKTFGFRAFLLNFKGFIPSNISRLFSFNIIYVVLIESIGQLYTIIDRFFFESLPVGGVASINYAQSLYQFPISIFTFALSTVIFPRISKAFSGKNLPEVDRILSQSMRIVIIIFVPISVVYMLEGIPLVKLIFERGKFSSEGTLLTSDALNFFAISLVFYAAYSVLNKVFYSAGLSKLLLILTITGIIIKYILNSLLIVSFSQAGLALSTSITYIVFLIVSLIIFKIKLKINLTKTIFIELVFNIFNALLAYIIVEVLTDLSNLNAIFLVKIIMYLSLFLVNSILLNNLIADYIKINLIKNSLFITTK